MLITFIHIYDFAQVPGILMFRIVMILINPEVQMKTSIALLCLFLSQLAFAQPQVIPAPVKHLYIPGGFDSNDAVEVVVTGNFPNPCHSRNNVNVTINEDRINVHITALVPSGKQHNCPEILVPFKEVISIGNLQGGRYKINVNDKLKDIIIINEASSSAVDEHLYAAIDNIERRPNGKFVLHGWRYSHCIEFDRLHVISNHKDTLSVLPIMKQVSNFCPMKMTPVSYEIKLDFRDMRLNETLIHVRTMDGKSFNSIVDLKERR